MDGVSEPTKLFKDVITRAVLTDYFGYCVLRAVLVRTIDFGKASLSQRNKLPFPPPSYSEFAAAPNPYLLLPEGIESVYANELAPNVAEGFLGLVETVFPHLARLNLAGEFERKCLDIIAEASLENGQPRLNISSSHALRFFSDLNRNDAELAGALYRFAGRKQVLKALTASFEDSASLEKKLSELESSHLVVNLPGRTYAATREGIDSFLLSPLSQMLLLS